MKNNFSQRVKTVVINIPRGQVMTYGQVAAVAGSPRAARAVGNVMKNNFDLAIPCHRVVCSDGSLGDYNRGGSKVKKSKLQAEGVRIKGNSVIFN